MLRAQKLKTDNLLQSYNDIIQDEFEIDLTKKRDQSQQFHLLLIFIKYIKVKYYGFTNKTIANFLNVESKKSYSIEKITEELKKDSSMIDFLQTHNMIPGSKVSIADAGEFSITITTDNNNYFGIDKFIAKRVFVV